MKKKTANKSEFWLRRPEDEPKFRIWSHASKKFISTVFPIDMRCKNAVYHIDNYGIVQQYIGCKDVNGKEIYEGDILETDEAGWIAAVVFGNGMFMCEDRTGGFSSYVNWGACKVIGNVYENPELLDK